MNLPSTTKAFLVRLLPYLIFTGVLLAITGLAEYYDGLAALKWHKIIELPLMLYLYFLLKGLLYGRKGAAILAALPLLVLYTVIDAYYFVFGRVLRVSELKEAPELFDILPWYMSLPILLVVVLPLLWILVRVRIHSLRHFFVRLLPLALLLTTLTLRPDLFLLGFASAANGVVEWSDAQSVRWNGRLSMVLYHEAKRRAALRSVGDYLDDPEYQQKFDQSVAALQKSLPETGQARNIHLIVLEGFVDPARFSNLKLNQDAVHPEFRKLLVNGTGDLSISPVWGGYTAQAEFEILCGVPALQKLSTIEFNLFSGEPIHCLPETLAKVGYQTMGSRGFKPFFFNSLAAMRAMGFEEIYFAKEYAPNRDTYLSIGDVGDEEFMFDRHMLTQNLEFVKRRLQEQPQKPLFNYLLTIYGHFPYRINEALRPPVIEPQGPAAADEELQIILNQHYYRSKATAEHVQNLIKLDPEALIIMVSDHLPPLKEGIGGYSRLGYLAGDPAADHKTLLAVIDRGKPVAVGIRNQYELPQLISQFISDNQYCQHADCSPRDQQRLELDYLRSMAHAVSDPS